MRQLRLDFGVLFGDTLQVYYEKPDSKSLPVKVCDICFNENSNAGVECIQALSKHNELHKRLSNFCTECINNPDKYINKKKAPKIVYPVAKKGTYGKYDGFSKPKRTLPAIPPEFKSTGEIAPILWMNGFGSDSIKSRELWDGPDGMKYVIGGSRMFEIFIIVGVDEPSGKLLADRWYAPE